MVTPIHASGRLNELRQVLKMLEKRADHLEKQISKVFEPPKLHRKKPIVRKRRLSDLMWLHKFADATTIHGLKEVLTETHPILHSIWTFLFCSCLALCGYHVCQVIAEYGNDKTISKIKIIRQDHYDFPVILLCPDTWLDADKVKSSGLSRGGIEIALAYLVCAWHFFPFNFFGLIIFSFFWINYGVDPPPYEIENHHQAGIDFDHWYEKSNFSNLSEFFRDVALNSEEFVNECTFCKNRSYNFSKYLMHDSVCYDLPVLPIEGGVSLGDPDIFQVRLIDRSQGLLLKRSYWRIFVNPDLSLGMSDTHFLHVFPGYANTIRIRPRRFKSLSSDQCLSNEDIRNRGGYSQASCMASCVADSQQLNCKPMKLYSTSSMPKNISDFCHSYPPKFWGDFWGIRENESLISTPQDDDVHVHLLNEPPECLHRCPPACEKVVYDSYVEAHPMIINGTLIEDETKFYFLNDVVQYFGVLSYEEVVTYSFDRLVSNVGGMLALWLGASVVSLIQLPFCICASLRKHWLDRRRIRRAAPRQRKSLKQTSV